MLKASTFCSLQKSEENKTHQLTPGISTAILGVMEPHQNSIYKSN
jgi:hypothetical protein